MTHRTTPASLLPQMSASAALRLFIGFLIAAASAFASPSPKPTLVFDIPAGDASVTLKQFAQQAKREIMFPAQSVSAIKTNAVQGEFTVDEALTALLAGTVLRVIEDQKTGALMVQRIDDPNGQRATPSGKDARPTNRSRTDGLNSNTGANDSDSRSDEPLRLSRFEVTTTVGKGYTSTNAATGFKTNEPLIRIPQAVSVVTRDFMDDIGSVHTTDIMAFVGVSNFFRGDSFSIRGTRIAYALVDEMPENGYVDNVFVDSITVIRGPAATLYMNASLGGLILKTSKVPLPVARYSVTAKVDETGFYRTEIDFTGPLGSIGDAKFTYRLVGAYQGGESFFKNSIDHRKAIHPTLEMTWKNTKVRAALEYQKVLLTPNANNIITPTGELYTGAGRDEAYFAADTMQSTLRRNIKLIAFQKFSDNWDMKISGNKLAVRTLAGIVFPSGGVNWPAKTMTFTARRNNSIADYESALFDVNGRYHIGPMSTQTTFGASYDKEVGLGKFWASPTFGSVTVPIDNPRMDLMHAPRAEDYAVPANPGAIVTTYRGNGYVQQILDVIPDRLSLIAGWTYSKIKINNVANSATNPPAAVTNGSDTIHRYAAVVNLTKELVVYGMESTTFAPQSNRDINLNFLPVVEGKGREVGIKTAFLDGRLSSTFAVFKMALTNQSFFAGVRPDGISYFAPLGSTTQKGFDMDITFAPRPGTEFMATFYHGTVRDQAGLNVPNATGQTLSFFGRYSFRPGALRGLTLGGGVSRISERTVSSSNYNTGITPAPALLFLKPGTNVSVFATYKIDSHWSVRANVENLLDEAYAAGAQTAYFVDPSPPRTVSASVTYKF